MPFQETWELSFLVDKDGRVLEGRGPCSEHLGLALQAIIGRSFLSFIADHERSYFRRFLGQLNRANAKRAALVSLQTSTGVRAYAMEAQSGRTAGDYWLMFSRDTGQSDGLDDLELPVTVIEDGQFLRLVELAASQAQASLDLTTIELAGLANPQKRSELAEETISTFERSVGEVLSENAHEGILSNPSPGLYNLLHDPAKSGAAIAQDLVHLAGQHGLSTEQAGITHATMSIAPNTPLASIGESLGVMRKQMPNQKSWETPRKPKMAEGQIAAALGIAAFIAGIAAVVVWMMMRI